MFMYIYTQTQKFIVEYKIYIFGEPRMFLNNLLVLHIDKTEIQDDAFCRNKQAVAPCLVLDASTELLCQNNGGWCCMLGMASGGST